MQRWSLLIVAVLLWVLGGCAAPLSQQAMDQVTLEVGFNEILVDPERHVGEVVALGGQLIQTTPHANHTDLLVLQLPLSSGLRPYSDGRTQGRFLVRASEFLDPALYAPNRLITLVGRIEGVESRPLGETQYRYPLLTMVELKLWPKEEARREPRFRFGVGVGTTF